MSDRDIIAATMRDEGWTCEYHEPVSDRGECSQCDNSHERTADRITAALRESRTIRTVAELYALPEGSVVRWAVANLTDERRDDGWAWSPHSHGLFFADGPAVVLYRPDEDGA